MEKVSVIVPVYNVEKYLRRCIESIIHQTYSNLEIILIDDGSTDNSPSICDEYKILDNRILVVHQENRGLSGARNVGLSVASGDYLCFVDSDDYIENNYVEAMLTAAKKNSADMVICNFKYVDEAGNGLWHGCTPIKDACLTEEDYYIKLEKNKGYYYVIACNKLYSRRAIGDVSFPEGKIHEDEATAHLFAHNCSTIVTLSDYLYNYVQRPGSIMSQKGSIKRLDAVDAFAGRLDFYLSNGYTERIDSLLRSIVFVYNLYRKYAIHDSRRLKEIDLIVRDAIHKGKPYVHSIKTRMCVWFPKHVDILSKWYRFCVQKRLPFVFFRLWLAIKKGRKRKSLVHSQKMKDYSSAKKKIIFLDTPSHGNLGDQAICESEKSILKELCPEPVFEFARSEWELGKKAIIKNLNREDVIFLPGGGSVGSLWIQEQQIIIDILCKARKNRIVLFPQTVFFEEKTQRLQKQFVKVCKACQNLTFMVRDPKSYDYMCQAGLSGITLLEPDVALAYKFEQAVETSAKNRRVLLCLRSDKEQAIDCQAVEQLLISNGVPYDKTDTVIDVMVQPENRKWYVDRKIEEFSNYSLVITDRLHAMIFSLLATTPCIAFDNISQKVSGVHMWIRDVDGIICIEPEDLKIELVNKYMDKNVSGYDRNMFSDLLLKAIKIRD